MAKTWIAKPVAAWLANAGHFTRLTGSERKRGRGMQSEIEVTAEAVADLATALSNGTFPAKIRVQGEMARDRMAELVNLVRTVRGAEDYGMKQPKGNTAASPADLLVICDDAGDLYRIFADGKCWPIPSEDDLSDVDRILNLPPEGSMHEPAGDSWRRIRFIECPECAGEGDVQKLGNNGEPVIDYEWEVDEETGRYYKQSCAATETCEQCGGSGWRYTWTDEFVKAEDVAKEAA